MAANLKIAWRNLGRNRRRTVITGLALAVGMSLCVATYGLMDGINVEMLRALTRLDLGHVQVHHPDYPRRRTLKLAVAEPGQVLAAARGIKGVRGASPRAYGFGLVSRRNKSAGVQLVGVDPTHEPRVTELHRTVVRGHTLDAAATPWPEGRKLTAAERTRDAALTARAEQEALAEIEALTAPSTSRRLEERRQKSRTTEAGDPAAATTGPAAPAGAADRRWSAWLAREIDPPPVRPPAVLLGTSLARVLGVRVGDRIYLISQTLDGLAAETEVRVAGVFRTGTDLYDRGRIYLHLRDLQRFLRLEGRVHEIALRTTAAEQAPALAARLSVALGPARGGLIRSWDVIRPDIKNMMALNEASSAIMALIIFIIASLGVVNSMLMAVFERTRELGVLKALGMSGWRILWMILLETSLLVLVGALAGLLGGLGLDLYLVLHGLDLRHISAGISLGGLGISPVIHGAITLEGLLVPLATLSLICFLAAFYPAARAARLRPAQGMREA